MNLEMILGFISGLMIGCILIAILLKITKTDHSMKCKYDERQELIRGKGFKYGFFTLIIFNFLAAMLSSFVEKPHIEAEALMIIGILIGIFVYVTYCIWHESYFSLNENPKRVLIAFFLIALVNLGVGYSHYLNGVLFRNGVLTVYCVNLFCGLLFLMIFLVLSAKCICKKREDA